MILTGPGIQQAVTDGEITITPFNEKFVNPNSYDFRLGETLLVYKDKTLDVKKPNDYETVTIPEEGYVLQPDKLYLGHSIEVIGSNQYVPVMSGKSSTGRVGLFVHISTGLIDIGSISQLTLMLHAVQPLRIYAGMRVGQVTFWRTQGHVTLYDGKYQHAQGPQPSRVYKDFETQGTA